MQDLSTKKEPVTPYGEWQKSEGVPIIRGLVVPDLRGELPMGPWPRKGVKGAFVRLLGAEESVDAYICEIPPAGNTNPERYMFEEEIFVVQGRGATTIWTDGGRKQTFEWQEGSVFSPPLNAWRQHFNGSPDQPVRLLTMTNAPVIFNLFRNADFIFNCDYVFKGRYTGEEDYFSGRGTAHGKRVWQSNFIPDVYGFTLKDYRERGAGGSGIQFEMAGNTIRSHIAEFPVGTYKKAHRHGPGAHIVILSGHGFSLMWRGSEPKEKIYWKAGALFVPPDMWFHQHFNTSKEPARYFAVHWGGWRVIIEDFSSQGDTSTRVGGHQLEYEDEDPDILQTFKEEMAKNKLKPKPLETWRR